MKSRRRALVIGASGQDGAYLCKLLIGRRYEVFGTSRAPKSAANRLPKLGLSDRVNLLEMCPANFESVAKILEASRPDEIYYLAGQTSVGLSFQQPVEAIESVAIGLLNVLEAMKTFCPKAKLFHAGSSEVFGDTEGVAAAIDSRHQPQSPYAIAKSTASALIENYRSSYGMWLCDGILFNHESPLREGSFVTAKIVNGAYEVSKGKRQNLSLGVLEVSRDWGWAPEYVGVMHMLLGTDEPCDVVIATGRTVSLAYFVDAAFEFFGLDSKNYVIRDESLRRPSDILFSAADTSKTYELLGWRAERDVDFVIDELCRAREEQAFGAAP